MRPPSDKELQVHSSTHAHNVPNSQHQNTCNTTHRDITGHIALLWLLMGTHARSPSLRTSRHFRLAFQARYAPSGFASNKAILSLSLKHHQLYATYRFPFDCVYNQHASQEHVYKTCAQPAVLSTLQGFNSTIIAYGQTGTGKTYTVEGPGRTGPHRGIIPRAIDDIFASIENDTTPHSKYLVRASYLQIYNEVISDLLRADRTNLVVREDRRRGVYVEGLSEWVVRSPGQVFELMEM